MPAQEPLWRGHERYRLVRPNAHRYIRHDAHRFMPPGSGAYRPDVVEWTGKRGRWTPERDARELAGHARLEAVERRETLAERVALYELKSAIATLRYDLAFERFKRAALRWAIAEDLRRKANFDPTQPRWPAGSGRTSGRWSGGAGILPSIDGDARLGTNRSAPRVRLASSEKPSGGRAVRNAILLEAAKRAIEAYRSEKGLWDLFRGRIGTVTVTTLNGENIFGSNSTSPTYSGIDFQEATILRDRYLQTRPDLADRGNTGYKPDDAFYHAEATVLLRAARANGGTLAGQTLEVIGDRKLCNSCEEVLPFVVRQLGNPTVTFFGPSGKSQTIRNGDWLKEGQQ